MAESESALPYGARFFDELRRLTNSTFGFTYADIQPLLTMDREQVLAAISKRRDLEWIVRRDSSSAEEFARAIVRERAARDAEQTDRALVREVIFTLLSLAAPPG